MGSPLAGGTARILDRGAATGPLASRVGPVRADGETKSGGPGGRSRAAHLAHVACAVLIWSTPFVATKVALAEVPPLMPGAARGLDTSSAVSMMNLVPIFGVLFAVLLLGEPLELLQVLGGLVVVIGVALSVREDPWGAPWEAGAKTSAGDAGPEFPAAKDRERGPDAEGGGAWGT